MASVTIYYDSGHPTKLLGHERLALLLLELGAPRTIERGHMVTRIEWPPIFPGTPDPVYLLPEPWPNEIFRRRIVRIEAER